MSGRGKAVMTILSAAITILAIIFFRDAVKTAMVEAEWARRADGMPQSWR